MPQLQLQSSLLRLAGALNVLAFPAVVMPRAWMEQSHLALGLGEMPGGPLVMFMIRQASFVYGMIGAALWVLASDVVRFRPLVRFAAVGYLVAAPVFFAIGQNAGAPVWWTLSEAAACAFLGGTLLALDR
jgi:hypothetical protein